MGFKPLSDDVFRAIIDSGWQFTVKLPNFSGSIVRRNKMALGHLWRFRKLYRSRPRLASNNDFSREFNILGVLFKHTIIGIDVHSKFLVNDELRQLMYDTHWNPASARSARLNFIGANAPTERSNILDRVEEQLSSAGHTPQQSKETPFPWYRLRPGDTGLDGHEYIQLLNQSDFTLCPAGYSPWSHRVIEALTRGSIPVLDERELVVYGVPLIHGKTCIAVENQDWPSAIQYVLAVQSDQITEVRKNIWNLQFEEDRPLALASVTRGMTHKLLAGRPGATSPAGGSLRAVASS